ncbi:MAG: hypothetical protein ACUVXA_10115 [Candidatus Jordarchaeum sp.]|uniref:hypothetical protein n=1 Tax=Candidatus Jordarchaeum sp. TaxID=2823881 RepID=UPI004049AADF
MLNKANSLVNMTESLKFALEKGWYDRAILLANGIIKITEILEMEIENTHFTLQAMKISEELSALYEI